MGLLEQKKEEIKNSFSNRGWICLARISDFSYGGVSELLFPNLVDFDCVEKRMQTISSDNFGLNSGFPYAFRNKDKIEYYRFGDKDVESEPIVYYREGLGDGKKYPWYFELAEEFRLYFRLYEVVDAEKKRVYLLCDECGNEIRVAEITPTLVRLRLKYLHTYLAVRKKALVLNFDFSILWEGRRLEELGMKNRDVNFFEKNYSFRYSCSEFCGDSGELVRGQLFLFPPNDVVLAGEEEAQYEEFILDEDVDGKEILASCNPNSLSGKNALSYMTPISFKREVLQKYYDNPQTYSVEDNVVRCSGFWSLRIDNGHSDKIVVMLGDLGRDLPFEEQKYWRLFNVVLSEKPCFSSSTWKRNFEGKCCESSAADIRLKERYEIFNNAWEKKYGWRLFKPLSSRDCHYFSSLRLMTSEGNQKEFNDQILALAKIFIDSLNESKIRHMARSPIPEKTKGIELLKIATCDFGVTV